MGLWVGQREMEIKLDEDCDVTMISVIYSLPLSSSTAFQFERGSISLPSNHYTIKEVNAKLRLERLLSVLGGHFQSLPA